jgi:hypothetical protein
LEAGVKHQLSKSAEPPREGRIKKLCFLRGGGACLLGGFLAAEARIAAAL